MAEAALRAEREAAKAEPETVKAQQAAATVSSASSPSCTSFAATSKPSSLIMPAKACAANCETSSDATTTPRAA